MKKIREVGSLSYSQMEAYLTCPRLWYERYILGHKYEAYSQALSFGIAFHTGMEKMMQGWNDKVCLENAISKFEWEYHFGRNPASNDDLYSWLTRGQQMLTNMHSLLRSMNFQPVAIEKECVQKNFRGRVDCLAVVNGKQTLIDWKTSSGKFDDKKVNNDEQLTAYGWMLPGEWEGMAFGVVDKKTYEAY